MRRRPENSAMGAAFLAGLMRWSERGNHTGPMTVPTDNVDAAELARVVVALKRARASTQTGEGRTGNSHRPTKE